MQKEINKHVSTFHLRIYMSIERVLGSNMFYYHLWKIRKTVLTIKASVEKI